MIYEVGDKVTLSPKSCYWGEDTRYNPRDVLGVIYLVASPNYCYVAWENGETNSYGEYDLKVLGNTGMDKEQARYWYAKS